jgi:histidinol-phosphate aminotransferase
VTDHSSDSSFLRGNFRSLPFFNPTTILEHEVGQRVHRMDLNECPYPPSPKVIAAIAEAAVGLNRYPDGTCPLLAERLSERLAVPAANICWGAGSTQLLTTIAQVSVGEGEQIVAPGLIWRRFAGVFQSVAAEVIEVGNFDDGAIDVEGLISAIGNQTRLVIVLTPNNPTGMMLDRRSIERVVSGTPDNVLLFIDEAYHEFAIHAGGADALELVRNRKGPWVVTRTFSKAYALAGLRLGYAICSSEELANAIRLATSTFNVTAVSEAAALAALDDPDHTQMILDDNARERDRLVEGMRDLGLAPLPSVTNFIAVDVGLPANAVVARMRERAIRIATLGYESRGTFIRVSTGLAEDTDAFLEALAQILQSEGDNSASA